MMNPASILRIPILEVPASSTAFRRAILGESQGSSSPLTPNTSAHSATRARFDEFFRVRDDEKAKMYKRVVFLCWFLGVIHALIIVAGLVLMYTSKAGDPLFTFFGVAFCYGNIGASTCLSVVVTVPVKEFDLDERLQQNPRIRRALFIALGLMSLLLGFLFITSFPYAPGIPLLLLGPRMLVDENLSVERRLLPTTKLFLLLLLTSLPIISLSAVAGLSPSSLTANFVLPGLWLDWAEKLIRSQPTSLYIYVASSAAYAISFFAVSVAWLRFARRGAAADAGWRTLMVYAALFCWTVVTGLVSIMQCIPVLLLDWNTMTKEAVPYYLACCASVLLPPLVALVVGPRKVFTLVARSFEYDLNRQKKDGALMAELAAASMFVDTVSNTRWVYRVKKSGLPFSTDRHQVQRQFWALGRIVRFAANGDDATLHLRVSMREDMDPTWTAHFSGTTAVFAGGSDGVVPVYSDEEFAQWVEANFSPAAVEETSAVNQSVTLIVKLTGRASNRDSLETWATGNLRLLEWRNFSDDLLSKSPRQLSSDEERVALYARSRSAHVTRNSDKLDFFVSHSWDDASAPKIATLRAFMERARSGLFGTYPTLWLDKVCIDQRNPGNALAVLPINIGVCKKVLILLSNSYLTRLWCVWELFTLFTFCFKELAVARVQVAALEDVDIGEFNIDHAHCFDPNEEFKLRQIIHDIGIDRLTACLLVMKEKLRGGRYPTSA